MRWLTVFWISTPGKFLGNWWSLAFRNYEGYLREQHWPQNPNYERGLSQADVMWQAIEKKRPKVILDMACGQGKGINNRLNGSIGR